MTTTRQQKIIIDMGWDIDRMGKVYNDANKSTQEGIDTMFTLM